jgi:hypothetical protein
MNIHSLLKCGTHPGISYQLIGSTSNRSYIDQH